MNILVFNQPINNRGDEAAHRALIRGLNKHFPKAQIDVFFSNMNEDSVFQMQVQDPRNNYINDKSFKTGRIPTKHFALRTGLFKLSTLHPSHTKFVKLLKKADFVVSAPGGPSIGSYVGWDHIYWLCLARAYNKNIAYYSRSIGPFKEATNGQKRFNRIAISLLKSFNFLSLRDETSMRYADDLNLSYQRSIDTAYLDQPTVAPPKSFTELLGDKKYVIFVPNSLIWAPGLRHYSKSKIQSLFVEALHRIEDRFKDHKIFMLPQLFNMGQMELDFFKQVQNQSKINNVVVLPDTFNSDLQQTIISKADLVVGARYHSIVFAINQKVPFVALSYEHKMTGMLEYLDASENLIDLRSILEQDGSVQNFGDLVTEKLKKAKLKSGIQKKAYRTATECMQALVQKFTEA